MVQLDFDDYRKGIEEIKYSVIARLTLQRRDVIPTNKSVKEKIDDFLWLQNLKEVPLKGVIFHILLLSPNDQSLALAKWPINLKPGALRFSRWYPSFDSINYRQTTSQVWIRMHDVPLEYRKEQNILNIVVEVGFPL